MADQSKPHHPATERPAEQGGPIGGPSAAAPTDGYAVGYKRPPRYTQFRRGQSGNPKGRPAKSRNLRKDLLDELSERIRIREGDRHRKVSKQRALLKAGINRGLGGDVKAIAWVFSLVARYSDDTPLSENEPALEPSDVAIIEDFLARKLASQGSRKEPATSSPDDEEGVHE